MLYHLITRCILPKSESGLEVSVLFIDTDLHFDILRLVTILERRSSQGTEDVIKQCLGRLFLVTCNSSAQLLLTLCSLGNMFCSHSSLCILMIDSISAFYWIDRINGGESVSLQETNLKRSAHFLEKLVREHHLVVFATTQTLMQKSWNCSESSGKPQSDADVDYRPYLCKSWQQLITHRIFFSKRCQPSSTKEFSVTACDIRNNSTVKRSFQIRECGIQF